MAKALSCASEGNVCHHKEIVCSTHALLRARCDESSSPPSPSPDVDVTSADMLAELEHSLTKSGVELRFAEVKDKLRRFELFERFGPANFYPTIGSAVDAYHEEHAIGWKP